MNLATTLSLGLMLLTTVACTSTDKPQTYADFLREHEEEYPVTMEVFFDRDKINKATPQSPIYICLEQQRGRLYVDGQVAADWPVSTGKPGKETPTGTFRILEKKKKHFSNTRGTIVDKNDICVVAAADSRRDKVPPGGEFLGAKMMNWMRLTNSGIGIHTGAVRNHQRVSHGCVRTPGFVADTLFEITELGSKVTISNTPETGWPGNASGETAPSPTKKATKPAVTVEKAPEKEVVPNTNQASEPQTKKTQETEVPEVKAAENTESAPTVPQTDKPAETTAEAPQATESATSDTQEKTN